MNAQVESLMNQAFAIGIVFGICISSIVAALVFVYVDRKRKGSNPSA